MSGAPQPQHPMMPMGASQDTLKFRVRTPPGVKNIAPYAAALAAQQGRGEQLPSAVQPETPVRAHSLATDLTAASRPTSDPAEDTQIAALASVFPHLSKEQLRDMVRKAQK